MKIFRLSSLWMIAFFPVFAGCSPNPVTGQREFIIISSADEISIGNEAAPEFEKHFGGKVPSETLQRYVRQIGQLVADVSHRPMPYQFALLGSDVPNAFALPGGRVYITAGLMSKMTNERQLVAVLGHEVGHIAHRHNVKALQKQMGMSVLSDLAGKIISGKEGQAAGAAVKIAGGMVMLRYSRRDEYQADELGIRYMEKAGYNPWGMAELLGVLEKLSEGSGSMPEMLRTHPLTEKRIKQAHEIIKKDYKDYSPDTQDPHTSRFMKMHHLLQSVVEPQK